MSNDDTAIPTSLALRIGLSVLDGASSEWLTNTFDVTKEQADASWLYCRELLSKQFAETECVEYVLLNESDLRERLDDVLRLLIDWRAHAAQYERLTDLTPTKDSLPEQPPSADAEEATPSEST